MQNNSAVNSNNRHESKDKKFDLAASDLTVSEAMQMAKPGQQTEAPMFNSMFKGLGKLSQGLELNVNSLDPNNQSLNSRA